MSTVQTMSTVQSRLSLAGVLATLLTCVTLIPLLRGPGWSVAVFVTVAITAGVGAAARQLVRWWPLVIALQLIALLLTLTVLFARDAAGWGVLPGPEVASTLRNLMKAGLEVTRQQAPPVQATRGVILLTAGGIGLIGLAVDLIAVTLAKPAVAGLPLLAVYCVPAAVLPGGLSWLSFVLGAAGYLVLVGADSGDRVRSWGRVLPNPGEPNPERALGGPLSGARRLTVGCLLVAALVPSAIPGLGQQLIGNHGAGRGSGKGGNITVINPILSIRQSLGDRTDSVLLRYRTTAASPEPLRIVSDDTFDGNTWSPSVGAIPRDNKVQDGLPKPPGLSSLIATTSLRTEIETLDLAQTYLPLPYPSTLVDIDGPWLYETRSLNVVGDNVNTKGLSYTVQHLAVIPTPAQLKAAPTPPLPVQAAFAQLPQNLPKQIEDTARRVAGDGTAYEQALALQQYFRNSGGFVYNETVLPPKGRGDGGDDAVLAFLRNKQGYCVQFASAMAVMARSLGIPARVAVGFLPGSQRPDGTYEISVRDAHAWPELYFQTVGWVRFEPTPSTRTGIPPSWAVPPSAARPSAAPAVTVTAPSSSARAVPRDGATRTRATGAAQRSLPSRILAAVPWRVLAGLLVVLALCGVPLTVSLLVRRRRWRVARTATGRVEAAWDELRERLEDLGVRWASSWTPRALQLRLVADHRLGEHEQAALGRLVTDLERVRYAPPGAVVREAGALRADVDVVVAGVSASEAVDRWVRRRARWVPASGLRAVGRAARRIDVAADAAGRRIGDLGSQWRERAGRR
jgi:transglutaminase-like putative cysteine protease